MREGVEYSAGARLRPQSGARRWAFVAGLFTLLAAPTRGHAEPAAGPGATGSAPAADGDEVRRRAKRVAELIARERFTEAERLIDKNLVDAPDPFVYLQGVLHERRGDCTAAVAAYRRYVALGVPAQDAEAARNGISRCGGSPDDPVGGQPGSGAPAGPNGTDGSAATGSGEGGSADGGSGGPDGRRWWVDPAGATLSIGGLAVVAAGGVVWGQAGRERRAAEEAASLSTYRRHADRAERVQTAGIAMVSIGAALVVAGAIRYSVVAARRSRGGRASSRASSAAQRVRLSLGGVALSF